MFMSEMQLRVMRPAVTALVAGDTPTPAPTPAPTPPAPITTGMNLQQWKYQIVDPCLIQLPGMSGAAALNLVTGTGIAESNLQYVQQTGGGPALGFCQMEPATEQDCWTNWFPYNPTVANIVQAMLAPGQSTPQLQWNLMYMVAMCRIKYWRAPTALPAANDAAGLATYWKANYNTSLGAGAVDATHVAMFAAAINA